MEAGEASHGIQIVWEVIASMAEKKSAKQTTTARTKFPLWILYLNLKVSVNGTLSA